MTTGSNTSTTASPAPNTAAPRPPRKLAIHTDLIRNLDDPSARGNPRAIAIFTDHTRRSDSLDELQRYSTAKTLVTVTTAADYDRIAELIAARPRPDEITAALLTHFGRFENPRSIGIVVPFLDHPETRNYAIETLGRIKASAPAN